MGLEAAARAARHRPRTIPPGARSAAQASHGGGGGGGGGIAD